MSMTRRHALKNVAAVTAATALSGCVTQPVPAGQSAIVSENQKPGTKDWLLRNPRIDPATKYRCPWIEGYCSHRSLRTGETIRFHVSTNPPSPFTIDIYRMGFYGGAGARHVAKLGPFDGAIQPDPPTGPKRLRDCRWPASSSLKIPRNWLSGVYLGKLTAGRDDVQSYIIFIVRDDRRADLLFQCSDNTWQAYNRWPDHFALYDNGKTEWYWGPNVQVSFNRPFGKYCQILDAPLSTGSGEWFLWEFPFAFWLESQGYDVSYISNTDTHCDRSGLSRAQGFLSIGHDEYWSIEMFRNVQSAIESGLNVGFFSGNAVCGRILYSREQQAFERVGVFGPPGGTFEFNSMRELPHERPYGKELMGAHSTGPVTGGADWTCAIPEHWIFAETGMKKGDSIPGLVGWEWHGDPASIAGLEVVASAPTQSKPGAPNGGVFTATVYPGPGKNFVFNAGTCWWADSLAAPPGYVRPSVYTSPKGPDPRAQQITRNILNRMVRS